MRSEVSDSIILASQPGQPSNVPTRKTADSGEFSIGVDLSSVATHNGSAITSYHVEIDNGSGGDYSEIKGGQANDLSLSAKKGTGITRGNLYRVRYRAKNEVGFGQYSEPAYILAASSPYTPDRPIVKFDGSKLFVSWDMPYNAGS